MPELHSLFPLFSKLNEVDTYLPTLDKLSNAHELTTFLESILDDDKILATIASRSYAHSNGFNKIVLYALGDCKLRLHFWIPTKTSPPILENIHYHRWAFVSKVLIGGYTNYNYVIDANGILMNRFIYYPRSGSQQYRLVENGTEFIRECGYRKLTAGEYLLSKPLELHRVVPDREYYTASLMIQGKDEMNCSLVYNEKKLEQIIESPSLTVPELKQILILFIMTFKKIRYAD